MVGRREEGASPSHYYILPLVSLRAQAFVFCVGSLLFSPVFRLTYARIQPENPVGSRTQKNRLTPVLDFGLD